MLRTGLQALQVSLALLCGLLVWQIASPLWSSGLPREVQLRVPEQPPPTTPAGSRYQGIAARNLFAVDAASSAAPVPVEKIAASRLQVRLLGTAATWPPGQGVASLEDQSTREKLSVRVGDSVAGATVRRIERGRVVVENAGHLEEIVFDEDDASPQAAKSSRTRRGDAAARIAARTRRPKPSSRAARISQRVQQLTERFKRSAAKRPVRAAAGASPPPPAKALPSGSSAKGASAQTQSRIPFLQQVKTTPEWSPKGAMLGLRVRAVQAGSVVARAGLQSGDLVTQVNGIHLVRIAQSYGDIRRAINAGTATFKIKRGRESLDLVVGRE